MSTRKTLSSRLDGDYPEIRAKVREWLSLPGNEPVDDLPMEEHRERVLAWAQELSSQGDTAIAYPTEYGGRGAVGESVAAFETLALGDLSLLVKCGVQFGLFGGAVLHLGTKRHHARYLADIASLELPGCFAMTESGHGSNVQALGTTATYDPETEELVLTTPDEPSRKDYIGNAAQHAEVAAVFAQLVVDGQGHGVHAVVVAIREDGVLRPGVRAEDDGLKTGLNGVDNGRLWFDGVRVPRDNLLNRFADVNADGRYESPIENPDKRFFTMLGTL